MAFLSSLKLALISLFSSGVKLCFIGGFISSRPYLLGRFGLVLLGYGGGRALVGVGLAGAPLGYYPCPCPDAQVGVRKQPDASVRETFRATVRRGSGSG